MNTENSKTNEAKKFSYYFTDKLNLKNVNKNIALVKGYLRYKTITSQNVLSEAQIKNFFIS